MSRPPAPQLDSPAAARTLAGYDHGDYRRGDEHHPNSPWYDADEDDDDR